MDLCRCALNRALTPSPLICARGGDCRRGGVILNLTVWFALHVVFGTVVERTAGPLRLHVPELASLSPLALLLSLVAVALLFLLHRGVLTTLGICGALALAWHLIR